VRQQHATVCKGLCWALFGVAAGLCSGKSVVTARMVVLTVQYGVSWCDVQVVVEAKAVFGADGKQTASRAGADGMAYTLSGTGHLVKAALWVAYALVQLGLLAHELIRTPVRTCTSHRQPCMQMAAAGPCWGPCRPPLLWAVCSRCRGCTCQHTVPLLFFSRNVIPDTL
jgi:hypothetical protein